MRWPDPVTRYWSSVRKSDDPNACWPWLASTDTRGYGHLRWNGPLTIATHAALELDGRPLKPGEWALHKCDNPICVNPAHLFAGSRQDNVDDMIAKGRDRKATGDRSGARLHPESRPAGETHGNSKLTLAQVAMIKASPISGGRLARQLGLNKSTVNRIRRGASWKLASRALSSEVSL